MNNKHNAGFSLIEVLVAIVILAAIVVPTCSSLVLSHRMNAKTEELMQAQLDVSSAVETLMAEGIAYEDFTATPDYTINKKTVGDVEKSVVTDAKAEIKDIRFDDVKIMVIEQEKDPHCYTVTFTSRSNQDVYVTTIIRAEGKTMIEIKQAEVEADET